MTNAKGNTMTNTTKRRPERRKKSSYAATMTARQLGDLVDQLRDIDEQVRALAPAAQAEAVAAISIEMEWFADTARDFAVAAEVPADRHGFANDALARLAHAVLVIDARLALDCGPERVLGTTLATARAGAWLVGFGAGLQVGGDTVTTDDTNSGP